MRTYTAMLVLTGKDHPNAWMDFATRLLPLGSELHLRGLVTVPAEKSLSEGALPAREWREAYRTAALNSALLHDEVGVFVDYQPFQRVFDEIRENKFDLLLVEWNPLDETLGGIPVETILQQTPCDLVLISDIDHINSSQPVLLALRGGPNLSIGVRVARALAGDQPITLFHAIDQHKAAPDLETVMRVVPQIVRTITAVTGSITGIVRESAGHDVIVMGAGLRHGSMMQPAPPHIFRQVYERTQKPMVLVRAAKMESLEFHAPHVLIRLDEPLSTRVDRWFAENTFHSSEFDDLNHLLALKEKQGVTISLALPALNEESTVGTVIETIKSALVDEVPLLDEMVLVDSNSTDNTVAIAQAQGIPTYIHQQLLVDEVGSYHGKGEALWKSLYVTKGDIIVWIDTDITNIHPRFVYGLIGPLLKHKQVQYVKGFYVRPLEVDGTLQAYGGGRVTELVARPLLNLFYPELSGIIQPLSGEYAGRRAALEQIPFFTGYGVETGMLIDILDRFGLDAIAQSDLETRIHYNQPLVNLSKMSFAILQVFIARLESRFGVELLDKANRSMKLIIQEPERFALEIAEIADHERPPMITVPAYGTYSMS